MNIVAVISSPREEGISRFSLKFAAGALSAHGVNVQIIDLWENPLPLFAPATKGDAEYYPYIQKLLEIADAILLSTPDYHGSMSGTLKNFFDYFQEEFAGKTFGYICSSHEKGLTVMEQMRTVIRQCYGWSLPYGVSVAPADIQRGEEKFANPTIEKRLKMMARDLVTYGSVINAQRIADLNSNEPETFLARYRKNNL